MTEIWKDISGFEGTYQVSDRGRVRSLTRTITAANRWGGTSTRLKLGQNIALSPSTDGYGMVHLYLDGVRYPRMIHRVVAEAFIGPRPKGCEILHNDGDKTNFRLSNLRYGTKLENEADKIKHGTRVRGETSGRSKLTVQAIIAIRKRRGEAQQALADEFGCTFSNISAIQLGKSWRHV